MTPFRSVRCLGMGRFMNRPYETAGSKYKIPQRDAEGVVPYNARREMLLRRRGRRLDAPFGDFAEIRGYAPNISGLPLRGGCRRTATGEVVNFRNTSSVTAHAVPPSPQGEGRAVEDARPNEKIQISS